jgi:hypothetical protein
VSHSIWSLYLISFTANFTRPTFKMSPCWMSYSYQITEVKIKTNDGWNAYDFVIVMFETSDNKEHLFIEIFAFDLWIGLSAAFEIEGIYK